MDIEQVWFTIIHPRQENFKYKIGRFTVSILVEVLFGESFSRFL